LVVRGQPMIDPALHEHLHQLHVVRVNFRLFLKGDLRRLFIRAFTKPDPNPICQQVLDILFAAVQVRLDHGPYLAPCSRLSMETVAPHWFTTWVARKTSSTSVPATKRVEMRFPIGDFSATARNERLSDREIKSALSTVGFPDSYECGT